MTRQSLESEIDEILLQLQQNDELISATKIAHQALLKTVDRYVEERERLQRRSSTWRDLMAERLALKLTQADMAVIIGVSRLTYIKWERNRMLMPVGRYTQICIELDRRA